MAGSRGPRSKEELTVPVMSGALVEGSELRRSQVRVHLIANFLHLETMVSILSRRLMVLLLGAATNNVQCDSPQESIKHWCRSWDGLRLGKQVAVVGLAVLRFA